MSFQSLLNDTVTIESFKGQDGYGQPTFGVANRYPARIQSGPKKIQTITGNEIVSGVRVYLVVRAVVGPRDRVTLPERFSPRVPPILRIDTPQDSRRLHHTVIYA